MTTKADQVLNILENSQDESILTDTLKRDLEKQLASLKLTYRALFKRKQAGESDKFSDLKVLLSDIKVAISKVEHAISAL